MPLHDGMVAVFCLSIHFRGGTEIGKGEPFLAVKISLGRLILAGEQIFLLQDHWLCDRPQLCSSGTVLA